MTERCPATNRNGEQCGLSAGWGTDNEAGPCKFHGGASPGAPEGNTNAMIHGAFSEHFRDSLTEREHAALDAVLRHLDGIDDERTLAAEVAGEALLKYARAGDDRMLREARMWMKDFNLMPNEETLAVGGSEGNPLNVLINRERVD